MIFVDPLPVPLLNRGNGNRVTKNKGGKYCRGVMEFEHSEVKPPMGCQILLICHTVGLEVIHFNYSMECRPVCQSVKRAYEKKCDQVIYSGRK